MPHAAAGFFGKLPCAGDFVQRRLPSAFVDVWDQHFEGAVAQSRSVLGDGWHEIFHASPVWHFVLAPGICGGSAWAGVMGPGTDRVGRCFPMVIASPVVGDAAGGALAIRNGTGWFDEAERVYAAAQADPGTSVDSFDAQVAALGGPLDGIPSSAPDLLHNVDWSSASHWRLPLPMAGGATPALAELWAGLAGVPGHWCLWWTHGAGQVPPSLLVTDGLPHAHAYAGFLDANHGAASWQSVGSFDSVVRRTAPSAAADVTVVPSAPAGAWLPDDLDLLVGLGSTPPPPQSLHSPQPALPSRPPVPAPVATAVAESTEAHEPKPVMVTDVVAGMAVLHRPDVGLSLVAAEAGTYDPRQQAAGAVAAIAGDMLGAELIGGMQVLRTRIMALNPQLRQISEDLIDPMQENCAVIAAHVANGQAELLRIGAAAGWHWRHGRLQPFFARSDAAPAAVNGRADDIDDLLFSPVSLAAPGLGATTQPTCGEVSCAVQSGDRLLLMATHALLQLPPELLARSLAEPSCDDARARIATAAGLAAEPARWPLALIEVHA
ncbi:MAG: type VI secretion system-associated protein TagF [Rhodanobacter sp.]